MIFFSSDFKTIVQQFSQNFDYDIQTCVQQTGQKRHTAIHAAGEVSQFCQSHRVDCLLTMNTLV